MRSSYLPVSILLLLVVSACGVPSAPAQVTVRVPDTTALRVTESTQVPVTVEGLAGEDVFSWEFELRYDEAVLDTVEIETQGTLAEERRVAINPSEPGRIRGAVAGTAPVAQGGVLFFLRVRGGSAGASPLTWEAFQVNEGTPAVEARDGRVTVRAAEETGDSSEERP